MSISDILQTILVQGLALRWRRKNAFYHRTFFVKLTGLRKSEQNGDGETTSKTLREVKIEHFCLLKSFNNLSLARFLASSEGTFNLFSFSNNWHSQNTFSIHSSCLPDAADSYTWLVDEMPKWISIIFCSFAAVVSLPLIYASRRQLCLLHSPNFLSQ